MGEKSSGQNFFYTEWPILYLSPKMCCLIALSILYRNHRVQEAKRKKQMNLKDPVLFFVDLMMESDRPMEDILVRGMELFTLEQLAAAERGLVCVMKGEKYRALYSGSDPDQMRYEAANCLKRIVWLLVTVRRYGTRNRYRFIQVNVDSKSAAAFARFKWYPLGLVPVDEDAGAVEQEGDKPPAIELGDDEGRVTVADVA